MTEDHIEKIIEEIECLKAEKGVVRDVELCYLMGWGESRHRVSRVMNFAKVREDALAIREKLRGM